MKKNIFLKLCTILLLFVFIVGLTPGLVISSDFELGENDLNDDGLGDNDMNDGDGLGDSDMDDDGLGDSDLEDDGLGDNDLGDDGLGENDLGDDDWGDDDSGLGDDGGLEDSGSEDGSDFDGGDDDFDFDDDFDDDFDEDDLDNPARWKDLQDQIIPYNAPDNTIVYANIYDYCDDSDDEEFVYVESNHPHYNLVVLNGDVVIQNLETGYTGTESVRLECNGIPAYFKLIIQAPGGEYPVANIGGPYHGYVNEPIQFDASLSTDNHGIVSYEWDFGDGSGAGSSRSDISIIYDQVGEYQVTLTVTDADGLQDSATTYAYITERSDDDDDDDEDEETPKYRTIFSRIRYDEYIAAGDILELSIELLNDGTYEMEDVVVTAYIGDLGTWRTAGPFDVDNGDREVFKVYLEIPADAAPGDYDIRFSASNENFRITEYREVTVE